MKKWKLLFCDGAAEVNDSYTWDEPSAETLIAGVEAALATERLFIT